MRVCAVSSVQPYVAMPAPVYVYLRANEKFVAVKAPLDFFTAEELAKWRSLESFYMPEFVDELSSFREAGRRVRAILAWRPDGEDAAAKELTPYELSDSVIRVVGRLWSPLGASGEDRQAGIESFFVSVFVSELCEPLSEVGLRAARDRDVDAYERGVLASGWTVFLALHLGYCGLEFLNRLRQASFDGVIAPEAFPDEVIELDRLVREELDSSGYRALRSGAFSQRAERAGRKVRSRLIRIERSLMDPASQAPSIYGEGGFA
ncbi:MAG TPA: hypothetical protein VM598_06145 [Bdellovibrionota bacterium]|nr:hypothetical protein [Bdellovibrionota bacterium]